MKEYKKKTIDEFPEKIAETASTHATENLYRVREEKNAKMLDDNLVAAFHHMVTEVLFKSSRT